MNKIKIYYHNDEEWNYDRFLKDIEINSENVSKDTPDIFDFVKMSFREPTKIVKMESFYNSSIRYDKNGEDDCNKKCNLENGVYVNSSRLPIIFKPDFVKN